MHNLTQDLNAAQLEAVTAPPGHYLVLAGAGSGKTRVLTHRIAWLCEEQGLWPHSMLAVTFTNKAAGEMRERLSRLLTSPTQGMWVGTFHSISHRLLRVHAREAGLSESFQILDADDQIRLVKRVIKELELDDKQFPAKQGAWMINAWKDEGLRPDKVPAPKRPFEAHWLKIYQNYQQACERAGVVDFAELLLRAYETLRDHPALLEHYRTRFRHVLVDEFQDTNALQYLWARLMLGTSGQGFVVGDDDQSIYSWRGARVENMHGFLKDFPGARLIKLEQNYRSTDTILSAANALISHNEGRLGKDLWTSAGKGPPIVLFAAHDEGEESRFVVEQIIRYADAGGRMRDAAILYRSNAQSRAFEEALMQKGLPYRVYGGVRFFERMEIKDALAYMRLLANPHDDQAFERAIATPSRGIGEKSVEQLRQLGRQLNCSSWDLLSLHQTQLPTRARTSLLEFGTLIEGMRAELKNSPLKHQIEVMLERSGLRVHYEKDQKQSRAGVDSRVENLDELINVAARFEDDRIERDESMSELTAFLSYAALEAGENQSQAFEDAVQLMTLHAAKGLEFPLVCLSGLEEGLFPLQRAIDERGGALEEERRLAYVGVTRACKQLVISYAESRRRFGEFAYARPSRFISEIPKHLISELRPRGGYARAFQASEYERPASHLKLGAQVEHPRFGEGVVLGVQGSGEHTRVVVNFESVGTKELVLAFCNLKAL